jgi:hypothetical protein
LVKYKKRKKRRGKKMKSPMPRMGPPTNLRPGGSHKQTKRERRQRIKEQLKKEVS